MRYMVSFNSNLWTIIEIILCRSLSLSFSVYWVLPKQKFMCKSEAHFAIETTELIEYKSSIGFTGFIAVDKHVCVSSLKYVTKECTLHTRTHSHCMHSSSSSSIRKPKLKSSHKISRSHKNLLRLRLYTGIQWLHFGYELSCADFEPVWNSIKWKFFVLLTE